MNTTCKKFGPTKTTSTPTDNGFVLRLTHGVTASEVRVVLPRALKEAALYALFNSPRTDVSMRSVDYPATPFGMKTAGYTWTDCTFTYV